MKKASLLIAGVLVLATSGSAAARVSGPWALSQGIEAGGYPLGGSGPGGIDIRFINDAAFWIGLVLHNTSKSQSLTIVGATTPEPVHSLAYQVGAAVAPYKPCTGNASCPYVNPLHRPLPAPLTVAPGHFAALKLSYRLVTCPEVPFSTVMSGDSLVVDYRIGTGHLRRQTLPIGSAKLLLARPVGEACLPRPYSYIGLVGSFTTSPEHRALPGSDGDTCSLSVARGLFFTSRQFFDRDQILWRVEIHLPQFGRLGTYGRSTGRAKVLGRAVVTLIGAFGLHSNTTFVDRRGTVTVTEARPPLYSGRFEAVLSGHHRFFRAYGAWRCTTKLH